MNNVTHGMHPGEVESLGRALKDAAERLRSYEAEIERSISSVHWNGVTGERFRSQWWPEKRARLAALASDLEGFGQSALNNATEQLQASSVAGGTSTGPGGSLGGSGSNRWLASDPRTAIADALDAVNDTKKDEIQIRRLDNGSYIVVLPGVVDLSSGMRAGIDGARDGFVDGARVGLTSGAVAMPAVGLGVGLSAAIGGSIARGASATVGEFMGRNDANSVRDMRHAIPGAMDPSAPNPYADRVKEAMQRAGVPEGADVMFVGHSYGAFTAAHLASDRSFNDAYGASSGYHVRVTHVVAAAAETSAYLPLMPSDTNVLVLNNNQDLVYQGEQAAIAPEGAGRHPNHLEVHFNGGLHTDVGHHPDRYTSWLQHTSDPKVQAWFDSAGRYAGPGDRVNLEVPDVD